MMKMKNSIINGNVASTAQSDSTKGMLRNPFINYVNCWNDVEKNEWLIANDAVNLEDHQELTRELVSSSNVNENGIIAPWMNKLIHKKVDRIIYEFILDRELMELKVIEGSLDNVSVDEKLFIKYASKLEGLLEIWLVRELGFADVWLVFSELDYEKEIAVISHCDKFLDERRANDPKAPRIDFLTLTPENFTGVPRFPAIHIVIGGTGDAQ